MLEVSLLQQIQWHSSCACPKLFNRAVDASDRLLLE